MVALFEDCADDVRTNRYFTEKKNLEELLLNEEIYWQQRAKSFWLQDVDSNSKFFHAYATGRRKKNQIRYLKDENGLVVDDHEGMCVIVKQYFSKIFSGDEVTERDSMESFEAVITDDQNRKLTAEFTIEEFSHAIKEMHPDKSAGPDGLNPAFYQHFWHLFGTEVFQCCKQWLTDLAFPLDLNDTTVVLIPKKDSADEMKDLRPLALCNVLYKVIAKVLANRLKSILPGIITDNQSAFVPGRNITVNVLLAFEMLHYMKQKKKGVVGEVALKLDVSKAYDRVDWGFLMHQMKQLGFNDKWLAWIQLCVTTVSYSVNLNGTQIGHINPSRGIR